MANPREAREADEKRATDRETGGQRNPANHPGSRYGSADEDRPDLAPEVEPAVKPDVRAGDVPLSFGGAMPENVGEDPGDGTRSGDVGRAPGKAGRARSR